MKRTILILTLSFCFVIGFSQIKVASNNNIGIASDNPTSKLSIGSDGDSYSKVYVFNSNTGYMQRALLLRQALGTSGWCFGSYQYILDGTSTAKMVGIKALSARGTASSSGRTFGIYATAGNATNGYNQAVYGELSGTRNGAAIFGATPGKGEKEINNIYAGYFRGKVYIEERVGIMTDSPDANYALDVNGAIKCNGFLDISSDERLKKDIASIPTGTLQNITNLRGVTYKLKEPEISLVHENLVSDTGVVELVVYDNHSIYERTQTGFIAQELQQVFPELVSTQEDGTLSINYIGIIPHLVEAIKEQQVEIEELKSKLNDLISFEEP